MEWLPRIKQKLNNLHTIEKMLDDYEQNYDGKHKFEEHLQKIEDERQWLEYSRIYLRHSNNSVYMDKLPSDYLRFGSYPFSDPHSEIMVISLFDLCSSNYWQD